LREGIKCSTEELPIKVKLDATPVYVITTNALDKAQGVEALEKAIATITAKMTELGGSCTIRTEVRCTS
jgi:translation initiation factor 2 subunit 1